MRIELDERQAGIVEEAARFARTVLAPRARENDERGAFPRELLAQMGERGYLGATVPREQGGLGLDPVAYGLLVAALERATAARAGCSRSTSRWSRRRS